MRRFYYCQLILRIMRVLPKRILERPLSMEVKLQSFVWRLSRERSSLNEHLGPLLTCLLNDFHLTKS